MAQRKRFKLISNDLCLSLSISLSLPLSPEEHASCLWLCCRSPSVDKCCYLSLRVVVILLVVAGRKSLQTSPDRWVVIVDMSFCVSYGSSSSSSWSSTWSSSLLGTRQRHDQWALRASRERSKERDSEAIVAWLLAYSHTDCPWQVGISVSPHSHPHSLCNG